MYLEKLLNKVYGDINEYSNKSNTVLLLEILSQVCLIGMLSYILRNTIEMIPFPLNGTKGYDHLKLKELASPGVITFFLVIFSFNMQQKIMIVRNRRLGK